ncbi:hypothetical protein Snoj_42230 [Streptomyces nojiriensis]|uniref:Uncharacterized protein n=1 Tax=Streptomyces nojiriensis TaxID=66374 RepID=A0ABQ3SR95_9ACTN|nr:hypothetical protein [Streptomyces nojiriensis]QTI43840.1 hypothetical protein JYK04_01603 [Streptomyces nojiriensis]GGR84110.1 hypothetical protein GCM10010205_10890 [Streptomyces nojiriensis]GHI70305.1 hypothetical protein Snoj_42230 [Streptomyces nojiriensis]
MPRPSSTGRVSPLFVFGAVLTAAGTALYLHPGPGLPLLALGAFGLAATVAVWLSARQR